MTILEKGLSELFTVKKPVIGMVHLKPLPGSPHYVHQNGMKGIIEHAVSEAKRLEDGGISGIQIENQFDRPFLKPGDIGYETVAAITAAAVAIRDQVSLPMGINIHLNGVEQAIAVAHAVNAGWVRAFALANAYVSQSGIIEAAGPNALRYRAQIHAEDVKIFGDFHVKHGSHFIISDRTMEEQVEDAVEHGADVLIITGTKTGTSPVKSEIMELREKLRKPLFIGSGFTAENAHELVPIIDGAIVGTYFKVDGKIENDVDVTRVKALMKKVRENTDS